MPSKIEWTGETWNPVTGCTKVSAGCANCYAEAMAHRLGAMNKRNLALGRKDNGYHPDHPFKVALHPDRLLQPLRWRKPRTIFVCSMGDLFHDGIPDEFIDRVFAVMAACPQHTFQVLTKRPERMAVYVAGVYDSVSDALREASIEKRKAHTAWMRWQVVYEWITSHPVSGGFWGQMHTGGNCQHYLGDALAHGTPLPNVWLGTSIEDQATADERIPHLLNCPAAVRYVSAEPLLGEVDFGSVALNDQVRFNALQSLPELPGLASLDWVIVGGESGAGARPMHPDWVRSIRDQCAAAGVLFFFKQWGAWVPTTQIETKEHGAIEHRIQIDPNEEPLQISWAVRVGKHRAGRLLDGVVHDAMPGEGDRGQVTENRGEENGGQDACPTQECNIPDYTPQQFADYVTNPECSTGDEGLSPEKTGDQRNARVSEGEE